MINTSSAPSQQEFSNTNSQAPQDDSSNRLWIILLIVLSVIIGFWLGFFINEYFYQNPGNEADSTNLVDELVVEPARDQVVEQQDSEIIEGVEGTGEEYIIFQDKTYAIGDTIIVTSDNECISEDLDLILTDIQENKLIFEVEALVLDRNINQFVEDMIEIEIEDQLCSPALSSCDNMPFDYCFSVSNVDGIYHLDYELREGTLTPLN